MAFVAAKMPFVSAKLATLYSALNAIKVITATLSLKIAFVAPKGEEAHLFCRQLISTI